MYIVRPRLAAVAVTAICLNEIYSFHSLIASHCIAARNGETNTLKERYGALEYRESRSSKSKTFRVELNSENGIKRVEVHK